MNCKDCKYWRRGGSLAHEHGLFGNQPDLVGEVVGKGRRKNNIICTLDDASRMGLCLHPSIGSDYVDCWLDRHIDEDRPDGVYAGCEEVRAYLTTGEAFGCIHFKSK